MITYPHINPIALEIGPLAVRWYGLAYLAGIFSAYLFLKKEFLRVFGWTSETVLDLFSWIVFGILFGGRIGYVLFYDLPYFLSYPAHVFAVWEGGMSYHGGALGAMVGLILFARKRRVDPWALLDFLGIGSCFGLFFGRLANFINGELYGRVSDVPWAMVFPSGGPFARHPSQLYEALCEGVLLFAVLYGLKRRVSLKPGQLFGCYVLGYGLCRFMIEFFREPDAQLGTVISFFSMGQVLCAVMVLFGSLVIFVRR